MLIDPHGWKLVDLYSTEKIETNYNLNISEIIESDIYNIWLWIYSPLEWFLWKKDLKSVLDNFRLTNWTVWPIPIVLDISEVNKNEIEKNEYKTISLISKDWYEIAVLYVDEIYKYDKEDFCEKIFWTNDIEHPWVWHIYSLNNFFISWKIVLTKKIDLENIYLPYWNNPSELRKQFEKKKWNKIVAFQTRNPPHRSHEYLQKCALENCDWLLVQPVIWKKKKWDFHDNYILWAYDILIKKYYKEDTTMLSVLPIVMRYAWPREAVLHAIIRQNFWCSHIIIWRDHAWVGDYYWTYDAQNIFDQFTKDELKIEILKYEHAWYCNICEEVTSNKTCPHWAEYKLFISGTKIRDKIKNKDPMPNEFIRKEVLDFLEDWNDQFIN